MNNLLSYVHQFNMKLTKYSQQTTELTAFKAISILVVKFSLQKWISKIKNGNNFKIIHSENLK